MGGEDRAKNYDDKSEMAYYWLEANMGRVLLVVAFAGLGLWGYFLEGQEGLDRVRDFIRYLGAEMAGIGIATVAIDALNEKRQRDNRKAQLKRQLGSQSRVVTEMALLELKHEGWLSDGTLREAELPRAELSEADLSGADLTKAILTKAVLNKAILVQANLTGANLRNARLIEAKMQEATLPQTNLTEAKMNKADLTAANLTAANLGEANLTAAILWETVLDQTNLTQADLSQVKYWTMAQLARAKTVQGATMPDGKRLEQEGSERAKGLTFAEWQAQYLAQHGGTETDTRNEQ